MFHAAFMQRFLLRLTGFCSVGLLLLLLLTEGLAKEQPKKPSSKQAVTKKAMKSASSKPKATTKTTTKKREKVTNATKPQSAKELAKLREAIERDKARLREVKQKERQVSSNLEHIRQKDAKLSAKLQKLTTSLSRVQDSLRTATQRINTITANAAVLRREYADLAYTVSRSDIPTTQEMMLGVALMPETALWEGTMNHVSRLVAGKIQDSDRRRDSLAQVKERFVAKQTETAALKSAQEAEKNKVESALNDKTKELQSVQADKQELIRRLEERNASARKLEAMMHTLVNSADGGKAHGGASEGAKADGSKHNSAMMKNANKGDDNSREQAAIEARAASLRSGFRRHSLPWPTDSHTILHKFGRYTNPSTGTLIENLGVGIAAKSGSNVRAVAKGIISLVNWLPGYGSLVIIDHGNTFRTVYANLASVSIRQGQTVKAGAVLGRSGRSVDGEYLHFELWHDRNKLNPAVWLE